MLGPAHPARNIFSKVPDTDHSRRAMVLALLLVGLMALSYLPVTHGERGGGGSEVWFESVRTDTSDSDDDRQDDTAVFGYDVDTDARNGTQVKVRLYVRDSNGSYVDDPIDEFYVHNDTVDHRYMNWTAEQTDNFTFELKLYHGEALKENRTYHYYLSATSEEEEDGTGQLKVWSINDYEAQGGLLYIEDDLYDDYQVPHGEQLLDTLELDPGTYNVTLKLNNDALDTREATVHSNQTSEVELRPAKESSDESVWYQEVRHSLRDTNDDRHKDTVTFEYDVDTDMTNGTEVKVRLEVYDSNDSLVDDPTKDHWVDNDTEQYWSMNWTARQTDNYTFELKLIHDGALVEQRTRHIYLTGTGEQERTGWLRVIAYNQYDGQNSNLYLDESKVKTKFLEHGDSVYGEFELEAGDHHAKLILANEARHVIEFTVHADQTVNITLRPVKEETGELELKALNRFDQQWGHLYLDDDLVGKYQLPRGLSLLTTKSLPAGEYEIKLVLANRASDTRWVELASGHELSLQLDPGFSNDTINVEARVASCGNCSTLDALHFYAHVRDEPVREVIIKVNGAGRSETLTGHTDQHGYWMTGRLDPGRYEWEALYQGETLVEGVLQIYSELGLAATADIHPHGEGEARHWNQFQATVYSNGSKSVQGALVKLFSGEKLVVSGTTNTDGKFMVSGLEKGWYDYRIEWPRGRQAENLLLAASQVFSYGPATDPQLLDPRFTPETGDLDSLFSATVWYKDPQGRAPAWVKVQFEGQHFLLQAHGQDHKHGTLFGLNLTGERIGAGQQKHRFIAKVGDTILETDWQAGPFIHGDAKPFITIKAPTEGARLQDLTNVTLVSEARTTAPYEIDLAYCRAAPSNSGGRPGTGDTTPEPRRCAEPVPGGRQSSGDPFTLLEEFNQRQDGVMTFTYQWRTTELAAGDHLVRARIFDAHEMLGEDLVLVVKPGDTDPTPELALAIEPLVRTLQAGGSTTFTVTITNTGNVKDTYELTGLKVVNSSAEGWQVTWEARTLTVEAGEYAQTTVTVQTPLNASIKDVMLLTILASSELDPGVSASAVASVVIVGMDSEGGVLPGLSTPLAMAGIAAGVVVASFRRRLSDR